MWGGSWWGLHGSRCISRGAGLQREEREPYKELRDHAASETHRNTHVRVCGSSVFMCLLQRGTAARRSWKLCNAGGKRWPVCCGICPAGRCQVLDWVSQKQSLKQGLGSRELIWEVIPGSISQGVGKWDREGRRTREGCFHRELVLWATGAQSLWETLWTPPQNHPTQGRGPGAFIHWLPSPTGWRLPPGH